MTVRPSGTECSGLLLLSARALPPDVPITSIETNPTTLSESNNLFIVRSLLIDAFSLGQLSIGVLLSRIEEALRHSRDITSFLTARRMVISSLTASSQSPAGPGAHSGQYSRHERQQFL